MNWKDDSKFPARLRQVREKAGLSQSEFAERVGVSRGAISTYELGDRVPDIRFLDTVIEKFGCSYDYLMGRAEAMRAESAAAAVVSDLNDEAIKLIENVGLEINDLAKMSLELFRTIIMIPAAFSSGAAYFQVIGAESEGELQIALDFFGRGNTYWNMTTRDFFENAKMAGYRKLSDDDRAKIRAFISSTKAKKNMDGDVSVKDASSKLVQVLTSHYLDNKFDGFALLELEKIDKAYRKEKHEADIEDMQ